MSGVGECVWHWVGVREEASRLPYALRRWTLDSVRAQRVRRDGNLVIRMQLLPIRSIGVRVRTAGPARLAEESARSGSARPWPLG